MTEEKLPGNETESKAVVERRLKPTLIRRRKKPTPPVEETKESTLSAEEAADEASTAEQAPVSSEEQSTEAVPDVKGSEESKADFQVSTEEKKGDQTEVRPKRIGVVGHIDLVAPEVKGEWKQDEKAQLPVRKVAKKKKSKAELDYEAIQRAGGLKSYAEVVKDEVVGAPSDETLTVEPAKDRVFRPTVSKRRKTTRREFKQPQITQRKESKRVIRIESKISVGELSQQLGIKAGEIINRLMALEIMATINQTMDADVAEMIAQEYGFRVEKTGIKEEDVFAISHEDKKEENLISRPPVVTVMGHVDHGKTSILDVIRKTKVAEGEAGGITQHIGAYEVKIKKGSISFVDTPGHEAFTKMRARGAKVTDIVVLVVAADDGVMPQTVEAIDHAKAAGVPIIVAVNKIDKANAQPDRVKQQLSEHGLVSEEWGGETIFVFTSAVKNEGIDKLLEMIILQAEILELKADPTVRPRGIVLEAKLDKGRGPVATVLVKEGTLKKGDYLVCGDHSGRIRSLGDAHGKSLVNATPSMPVEILGLSGVPSAGDEFIAVEDEKDARTISHQRQDKKRTDELAGLSASSLEQLQQMILDGEIKTLNLVVKADVRGTSEAVVASVEKISTDKAKVKVIHTGVGGISENDVMLAAASQAVVVGFNVSADGKAREAAQRNHTEIRTYKVIYEMIDDIRKALTGLLEPTRTEVVLGRAQVRDVFRISKVGAIAGCMITSGKVIRNARVRLLRDQAIVFDGVISSLKRFKDDAKEVLEGYECGIGIQGYNDIKVSDEIEAYIIEEKKGVL
ncbi:MAG: translation initiation factor IF-2 [Pseudomonadota bacterium]